MCFFWLFETRFHVAQDSLELTMEQKLALTSWPPASASEVLAFEACIITFSFSVFMKSYEFLITVGQEDRLPFLPVVYLGELHYKRQKGRLQIMPRTCSHKPGGSRIIAETTFDILLPFFFLTYHVFTALWASRNSTGLDHWSLMSLPK